jgi:hypothetical protein
MTGTAHAPHGNKPGSWLRFVCSLDGLTPEQADALDRHAAFLDELETTPMTKSYKMLVVQAMPNEDRFSEELPIDTLGEAVSAVASRNSLWDDLGPRAATPDGLRAPIDAWTGGRGTGGTSYFAYDRGVIRGRPSTSRQPTAPRSKEGPFLRRSQADLVGRPRRSRPQVRTDALTVRKDEMRQPLSICFFLISLAVLFAAS